MAINHPSATTPTKGAVRKRSQLKTAIESRSEAQPVWSVHGSKKNRRPSHSKTSEKSGDQTAARHP
jgi:hypothetical protein